MISKKFGSVLVLFAVLVMLSSIVNAVPAVTGQNDVNLSNGGEPDYQSIDEFPGIQVYTVFVEGVERSQGSRLELERGQEVEVKVELVASDNVSDVTILASIYGDDDVVSEHSETFDAKDGNAYIRTFDLEIPADMDRMEYYLFINVRTPNNPGREYNYPIEISTKKHSVVIRDVSFNPSNEVKAGRALLSVVRVKNVGVEDEDSVKVKVDIPELDMQAVDYIDELESEDSVSSEEMYLRIPSTAKSGEYDVIVTVEYDDGDKETEEEYTIKVVDGTDSPVDNGDNGQSTSGALQITAGPQSQDTARGQGGVIYPVSITNPTSSAKSLSLAVNGIDSFGTVKISPSTLLVVESGTSETFYVYVSANEDAALGSHTFGVSLKGNNEVIKEFPLNVNVIESDASQDGGWDSVKKGLLVGLVVLIVLLIILGLIIAFNKMKGSEDDDDELEESTSQTYY